MAAMRMRRGWELVRGLSIFVVWVVVGVGGVWAKGKAVWEPTAGHRQVAIWPGAVPDASVDAGAYRGPEVAETTSGKDLVAGRPWVAVEGVTRPTMTVYSPKGKNTGVAVVVFPGGGYQILAIDLEGTEVCDWLTAKGITCVLLKYRVPCDPAVTPEKSGLCLSGPYPESPVALEDAQRTLGLVRFHAAEWGVNPKKIGVLGFSAGGHLVAATSTHFARVYKPVDAADKVSCRPDFAVAVYPGHLTISSAKWDAAHVGKGFKLPEVSSADGELALNPEVPVTARTPPTFLLQNEDDSVDGVNQALAYYIALKKAGVPVEMHLYAQGGHAFGLRRTKLPATRWPELLDTWLVTIGMLPG